MITLEEFLKDTQTAIGNGFGNKEIVLRMFNSLVITANLISEWESSGSYCIPIEDIVKAIQKELN